MKDGRKIIEKFENPIDNLIINLCTIINQNILPKNISPNIITFFSLILGLISSYLVYQSYFLQGSISWIISYFLDCLDGNYARMHNKCTAFGDKFDHFSDKVREIAMIFAVIFNNKIKRIEKIIAICVILLLFLPMLLHLGCQEKISNSTSKSLNNLKNLCYNAKIIRFTKFFGCGTINFILIIILMYFYFTYQYSKSST